MNRVRASLFFFGLLGAVLLAACGGAPGEAKTPAMAPSAEEREPTSVAQAQDQIERARAELAGEAKKAEADKDTARAPTAPGAATGGSTAEKPASKPAPAREETSKPNDPCASSCRALSSMRRAVSALCRMTGDEDTRCSEARRTLQQSESRVAQCHCGP
jgi:hypothetical protein